MARPRKVKITPEQESAIAGAECAQPLAPAEGDIIQITTKPHNFLARIGIVHTIVDDQLICYAPGRKGFPHKFKVATDDVAVVGKARLKWSRPLPEESVYADNKLDAI